MTSRAFDSLYDCDLHAKRVLSLANATQGVLTSASLAVHAVGQGLAQGLAQAQGKLSKHGVKQVDRLLSNDGIVLDEFFSHRVPYTFGARPEGVVALDWTSFARDGHGTLVPSVLTHHGRATPLMWKTVRSATLKGNQTRYEPATVAKPPRTCRAFPPPSTSARGSPRRRAHASAGAST